MAAIKLHNRNGKPSAKKTGHVRCYRVDMDTLFILFRDMDGSRLFRVLGLPADDEGAVVAIEQDQHHPYRVNVFMTHPSFPQVDEGSMPVAHDLEIHVWEDAIELKEVLTPTAIMH